MFFCSARGRYRNAALAHCLVVTVLLCCTLPSCNSGQARLPNVVIIVMDTMRADHLGCYGYERATSPVIDAFARSATLYSRHITTSPWTVPTHASLFTGKYPFEHGAHTFEVSQPTNNVNPLHERHLTLAEVLEHEGYATGAFCANDAFLSERWQMNQGFDTYHVERVYADVMNLRVFEWLDRVAGERFFLFINYIDTHNVYNTKPRPGLFPTPAAQDKGELLDSLYQVVMPGDQPVPEDLAQRVIDQYDTAVANVDEQVGRVFEYLRQLGVYENTIIVLTSDHGEYFGEHRLVTHSKDVYQEAVWAPLIVKEPHQTEGYRIDWMTSAADIPQMIFASLPASLTAQYENDFPSVPGKHPIITENYYTRTKDLFHPVWGKRFNRIRTAIYEWPYKYIRSSDGQSELYRLDTGDGERTNLIDTDTETARRLHDRLMRFERSRPRSTEMVKKPPLTAEELERLRSLGYVGN